METIKNFISLIVAIVVGFLGLKFCLYGLIVSIFGASLQDISIRDIYPENLKTKRYINIIDAASVTEPLELINGDREVWYVYPLIRTDEAKNPPSEIKTNILLESDVKISNWEQKKITGLLKPYWYNIDEEIIYAFSFEGVEVDPDGYYLELNSKPIKWYWYILILSVAVLFFYRLIEAILTGIKKDASGDKIEDEKLDDEIEDEFV